MKNSKLQFKIQNLNGKWKMESGKYVKAFTLIELLVVIAIIGALSAFLVANFIGVKQRARDAQRKSDLRQIQGALEIYRSDQGSYPDNAILALNPSCGSALTVSPTVYMQNIPCDPLTPPTAPYVYTYTFTVSTGTYTLRACLENTNDSQKDATNTCTGGVSYTLKNP